MVCAHSGVIKPEKLTFPVIIMYLINYIRKYISPEAERFRLKTTHYSG